MVKYAVHLDRVINTIRGKNLVGHANKKDVEILLEHIDALELFLDEHDEDDYFGSEGWRHRIGLKD